MSKNNSILNNEKLISKYVAESFTYSDVLRRFNLKLTGGNLRTLKKYIKDFGQSTNHFNPKAHLVTKPQISKLKNEDIFCLNSKCGTETAKRRILRDNLLPYVCDECGIIDSYNKKPITLQLEHKNGNNRDHRLENLEFLCPNCHSQTLTYGAKNRESYKNKDSTVKRDSLIPFIDKNFDTIVLEILDNKYKDIDDVLNSYGMRIKSNKRVYLRNKLEKLNNEKINNFANTNNLKRINYPSVEELLHMLKEKSYRQVAKEIGCSDNAIRKYLIRNNIEI